MQLYIHKSQKRYCFWAASYVLKETLSASFGGNFLQVIDDNWFPQCSMWQHHYLSIPLLLDVFSE